MEGIWTPIIQRGYRYSRLLCNLVLISSIELTKFLLCVCSSVEWCQGSDQFSPIVGEFVLTDLRTSDYIIPDLNKVYRQKVLL